MKHTALKKGKRYNVTYRIARQERRLIGTFLGPNGRRLEFDLRPQVKSKTWIRNDIFVDAKEIRT